MAAFTHLHLHTQYSFLDGAIRMGELCPRIAELGMKSCAVTEHGNLFGAIDFYRRAKEHELKPIVGMEANISEGPCTDRSSRTSYHLILLAKDREGYGNLMRLSSAGYLDGFYYKPRVDKELLKKHAKGLIALTGCLGGEAPKSCLNGDRDRARAALESYQGIFEPGHLFVELQDNGRPEQARINQDLLQLAQDQVLPVVATNNCHYKMRDDASAHDVLLAIQYGKSRNDPSRRRAETDALYIRSAEEMASLFKSVPEAIANTQRITEMIDLELSLGQPMLPTFVPPDGSDLESHLRERSLAGLRKRFRELPYRIEEDVYLARLEEELGIIIGMKFPGYFLIVADFINWAKERGIPVGPGRGSGAGSLVAYALRITDLDPIPYNLLFERFLNPERVSMPDFDVDFCQERRGEVIDYVSARYGDKRVGQIATFSQMKAKSVIKDVSRCLEVPFAEVNALTKLLPNTYKDAKGNVRPITIEKALEIEPKLRELQNEKSVYKEVIEIARRLEGLYRQAGMHAAGIVIGNTDLWDVVPVFRGNDDELITQFSMADVELAGLVKFDFLGLKTLDVIDFAEKRINAEVEALAEVKDAASLLRRPHIRNKFETEARVTACLEAGSDIDSLRLHCALLPIDDPKVYRMISQGDTLGVFQLESTGFQELLKRLKPDCFEDIVAAVALYRPGPLQTGMVDDFIDCKHGRKKVSYPHPLLEEVLKPTYGGFVYQEQVMQAAQVMAGYSLGGADLLRRAMGKKKPEVMAKERVKFVAGCKNGGIPESQAADVFDLMEKFAGYGFNKSHSAAYALITYQTAFLKAYFPVEFMAALLSTEVNNTDNIVKYIAEARAMRIEILSPDVNLSDVSFSSEQGKVRFGLSGVKGLGEAVLEAVLRTRAEGGSFRSMYDFCDRVPLKQLNKKGMEALICSGAFDCFGKARAQLADAMERAMDAARSGQAAKARGQASLFGTVELQESVRAKETYREDVLEWPESERLKREKNALGFYITGHPLDRYRSDLGKLGTGSLADLQKRATRSDVKLAVVVTAIRERPLRDGSGRMAFVAIEDLTGAAEVMVSSKLFATTEAILKSDMPLLLKVAVAVDRDDDGTDRMRLRCLEARSIAEIREEKTNRVTLMLSADQLDDNRLALLRTLPERFSGRCGVEISVALQGLADVDLKLPESFRVEATDAFIEHVERVFGAGSVRLSS
jgi:DNA polymerase III subunit alpha